MMLEELEMLNRIWKSGKNNFGVQAVDYLSKHFYDVLVEISVLAASSMTNECSTERSLSFDLTLSK